MDAENFYEILGIGPNADDEEVKQAFRELAKNYHPDRNPGDEDAELRFKLVGTAYDALKDASRRQSYNEWLAFNDGQQKSRRRQWSRLAAVLALLLLGPSAVLYGVVAFGGTSIFDQVTGGKSVAASEPAKPEKKKASVVEGADKLTKDEEADKPEDKKITGASEPKAADLHEAAPKGLEHFQEKSLDGTNAIGSAETSAPGASENTAAGTVPADGENDTRAASADAKAPDAEAAPVSPEYTQAIHQPSGSDTEKVASVSPEPALPASHDDLPGGANGAIASARMLAKLKEPEGGEPVADPQTPRASAQPIATIAAAQSAPDTFSDCEFCPLMSLTRRPETVLAEVNLAVSLSEITVAQWNVCVEEGGCPPYRAERDDPAAPVIGLSVPNAGAYAEWLSAHTGERYRIVAPLSISTRDAATPRNCDPIGKSWDWLDEPPRRKCPPVSSPQAADNDASGFRVARPVRHEG